mmetsp:Transcript_54598/g.129677  ORF Transcript_54598/g.129677 Transcript_54598/m.129677 type:complete len:226 (-) Transcript_54598:46-723(-)
MPVLCAMAKLVCVTSNTCAKLWYALSNIKSRTARISRRTRSRSSASSWGSPAAVKISRSRWQRSSLARVFGSSSMPRSSGMALFTAGLFWGGHSGRTTGSILDLGGQCASVSATVLASGRSPVQAKICSTDSRRAVPEPRRFEAVRRLGLAGPWSKCRAPCWGAALCTLLRNITEAMPLKRKVGRVGGERRSAVRKVGSVEKSGVAMEGGVRVVVSPSRRKYSSG